MIIRKDTNRELFESVRKILSLNIRRAGYNSHDVQRKVIQFNARINLNTDNTWQTGANSMNGQGIVVRREDIDVNKYMHHAFKLLGSRSLSGVGNSTKITFVPRVGNTITQIEADKMIRTLISLRNLGFDMIYSGYNSSDEFIMGSCITGKVPQYARRNGEYMSIQYAEEVIVRLAMLSDMVRVDMNLYNNLMSIQHKRKNYTNYIKQSDNRYARMVENQAKIVDVAMQGMKKSLKVRAVMNLVIKNTIHDEYEEERIQGYRDWISNNPFTDEDIQETNAEIQLTIERMKTALRNVKCPITEGQRIFNELNA